MGFLSSMLPTIAGAGLMAASGGTINPMTAGLIMGGLQTARTGSLQKGIMAGMGAYGGAGLAGGLAGAGAAAAEQGALNQSAAESARLGMSQAPFDTAAKEAVANTSSTDLMSKGISSLGQPGGFTNLSNTMSASDGPSLGRAGLAAALPAMMQTTTKQPEIKSDSAMPQRLQYNTGRPTDAQGQVFTPAPDVPGYGDLGRDFGKQQSYFPNAGYQKISDERAKELRGYAGGGPVEAMSNANAVGANTGFPQADIRQGAYATPWQTPVSQNVVQGTADTGVNVMTGEQNAFAKGGLSAAASHLGDYSDGGRLLKGPGDGVSDSIPATIGNKRPARLADGEFVVPARIVSELGNGSTEAGARKLYAMLDRVQAARKKSIGKGKVAKNSRADKLLPA